MSGFTIRVELHDANWADYEKLHREMERNGFVRTVVGSDNVVYELPPAEYLFDGNITKWDVLEKARSVAAAVKPSPAVLVSECNSWAWVGLNTKTRAVA
jgi:hypothetical protein